MKDNFALRLSFTALFAALITVAGYIKIPLGIIPVAFQNILCILSGAIIGGFYGVLPVALFLFVGFLGLPVYSGGTGGISVWLGPTGGFLPGYFLGALVTSVIIGNPKPYCKDNSKKEIIKVSLGIIIGTGIIYIPGVLGFSWWLIKSNSLNNFKSAMASSFATCVIPFLPTDLIKIVISIPIALKGRKIIIQYFFQDET